MRKIILIGKIFIGIEAFGVIFESESVPDSEEYWSKALSSSRVRVQIGRIHNTLMYPYVL